MQGLMQCKGMQPNYVTFLDVLNVYASVTTLKERRVVDKQIIQNNCESNVFVGCGLFDKYAKCRNLEDV